MTKLIGTGNNQVSTNGMLGGMAFQSPEDVQVDKLQEQRYNVVTQQDIGTAPNQVPINGFLGSLAYLDSIQGIDFSPSTGTVTATSNILDDYEEGTWTPSFNGYSTGFTGTYTKIGRKVTIKIQRATSIPAGTLTTGIRITGIPFTPIAGDGISASIRSQFVSGMLSGRANGSLSGGTAGAAIAPMAIINANGIDLHEQDRIWTSAFLPTNTGNWIMPSGWQNGSTAIYIMWEFTYQTTF